MKAILAASVNKRSLFLFFTLPGTEKALQKSLPRIPTAIQPPGAEIKSPAKRVVESCGKKVIWEES